MSEAAAAVKPHDFRRPDLVDRQRLGALAGVFEGFARHATVELSTLLRCPCQLSFTGVDQHPWAEVLGRLPERVDLALFTLAPVTGTPVLALSQAAVMAVVDLRMGGNGEVAGVDRRITEIDQALLAPVLDAVLGELARSVAKLIPLRARLVGQETNPQFVQVAAPHDTCVVAELALTLGSLPAEQLTVVLPAAGLGPLLDALRPGGPRGSEDDAERVDPAAVSAAPVEVRVRFPKVTIRSGDLLDLVPGSVIALGHPHQHPLEVVVADVVVAGAERGSAGPRAVARITHRELTP